jgi:hypothetical protein
MSQNDDYLLRGALRRLQIIPRNIKVDDPEGVQGDVPEVGNGNDTGGVQQERGEVTQERGGVSINIDEEAGDWIKKVRDDGGGLTIGPDDGIIAVPEGPGEREPVEEEPVESEPETVDDIRKLGRDALASPAEEEEVEGAIQKTMFAIRQLMAGVERRFSERRKHD